MLNTDYSVDECAPVVDAGDDALGTGSQDYFGNPRYFNVIDIGAYEAQGSCMNMNMNPWELLLQDQEETHSLTIYPNPTNGRITIESSLENLNVSIMDMLGRVIYESSKTEVDMSHLDKGIYLLQLSQNGKFVGMEKIIKQ